MCSPAKPSWKEYSQLVAWHTAESLGPKANCHCREILISPTQPIGSGIYSWLSNRFAKKCCFGDFLEEALQDCFVLVLLDEHTRRSLLLKKDLTIVKAVEMAQVMTAVSKDATAMSTSKTIINTLWDQKPCPNPCYRRGNVRHVPHNCRYWKPSASTVAKLGMLQLYIEWGGNPDLNPSDNWKRIHRRIY